MIKHTFECKHCKEEIKFGLFQVSAITKCEHCKKEYIVIKNKVALALEIVFLFAIAMGLRTFLFESSHMTNVFLQLVIVLFVLLIVNCLFDILFIKVFKWKKYYSLVERATRIPSNKK